MSSQNPGTSQGPDNQEIEWALRDGTMEVISIGKRDAQKDEYMTIDLVFTKFKKGAITFSKCSNDQ